MLLRVRVCSYVRQNGTPRASAFTVLRGTVGGGGALLVSDGALQHLHVGLELVEQTSGPALPALGDLAVVHPVGAAVACGMSRPSRQHQTQQRGTKKE